MSYQLQTPFGGIEEVIDDNCGISKFYMIAGALSDELKVKFINQVDDADTLNWDFKYKKYLLTLSYNIFNGVSILPGDIRHSVKVNRVVEDLAQHLRKRAF